MTTKPLLVGEAPSRTSDPLVPFSGRAGDRLRDVLGRPIEDVFDVRNLLDEWPGGSDKGSAWDREIARERAVEIMQTEWSRGRLLVLAGRRVAYSFAFNYPYLKVVGVAFPGVVIPHPSGVNRWFNDHRNFVRLAVFFREAAAYDSCIDWPGAIRSKKGYGGVRLNGRVVGAHRWAWQTFRGPIPRGAYVLHRCDRPVCVNPAHLYLGTPQENSDDAARKGRWRKIPDDAEVVRLYGLGYSLSAIGERYGVTKQAIWLAIRRAS